MRRLATNTEAVVDPVCGMKVDPSKTDLVTTYQGCSYYFSSWSLLNNHEPIKRLGGRISQSLVRTFILKVNGRMF